jgi:hypothetical protein
LIPPLARIPEGNWYCPSCIGGKHSTQDVTERAQIPGKRRSKKFQGEINCLYLEALTHLSAVIEEKEYWEYSAGEVCWLKPIYVYFFTWLTHINHLNIMALWSSILLWIFVMFSYIRATMFFLVMR